jgi:hypothetical protein
LENLKTALIKALEKEGLNSIVFAVKYGTSNLLSASEQQLLQNVAARVRHDAGLTSHVIDLGFTGSSPAAGSPGRFSEISE